MTPGARANETGSLAGVIEEPTIAEVIRAGGWVGLIGTERRDKSRRSVPIRPTQPPALMTSAMVGSSMTPASEPVSFARAPGVILDGFHEVFVDGHGLQAPLLICAASYCRRRRRGSRSARS